MNTALIKHNIYKTFSPSTKIIFNSLYLNNLIKDCESLGIHSDLSKYFYKKAFEKSYLHHSPLAFLPYNHFNYSKILFNIVAAKSYSELYDCSLIDIVKEYNHNLKYLIRDNVKSKSVDELFKEWGGKNVSLFNIFNFIKFKKKVMLSVPWLNAFVLDVGSSVGGASWLAYRFGANKFTLSDIKGSPLEVAQYTMKKFAKNSFDVPINSFDSVEGYGEKIHDIAMCLHVFEHTIKPQELAKSIIDSLKPGGYFLFSYYKATVGDGINTTEAILKRDETLKYINSRISFNHSFNLNPISIGIKVI